MWAFEAGLTGSEVKAVILNLPIFIGTQELIDLGFEEYRNSIPSNLGFLLRKLAQNPRLFNLNRIIMH